ncbi:MAG: bifunctional glutamate N-acetyltransferase/amino-acid acetyltransferase ArgJ [Clostridiales bacterium]|nr:bifunctional glutamate N-acetyltransferase/amino-acid acetyltransferase ArgJ [Clostridiales bacterium]
MEFKEFDGFKYIDGGVCAAKGFKANGLNCGYNPDKEKNDLCLVASDVMCNAAGVYTQNKVKGAPVIVTKNNLAQTGGKAKAIIANSKNANTCNVDGMEKALRMCELAASKLDIKPCEVIVASTGVIGQPIPIEPVETHIDELYEGLSYTGNAKAANAIMTTDTSPKEVAVEFELDGKICHLGGMGKGSGMIHPNMATTLNFITTDAAISSEMLQKALTENVKITYNCLSIDGDQSTNDTLTVMANGLCGNVEITEEDENYKKISKALYIVMMNITKMLAGDGEGATKLLECTVSKAKDVDSAIVVAKSVICSPLFKCAMFGEDANWGRILCAVGNANAELDIDKVDVDIASKVGAFAVCKNGSGVDFSEDFAKTVLGEKEIHINISLNSGDAQAQAWGCDLTYDYVKINGDYRS